MLKVVRSWIKNGWQLWEFSSLRVVVCVWGGVGGLRLSALASSSSSKLPLPFQKNHYKFSHAEQLLLCKNNLSSLKPLNFILHYFTFVSNQLHFFPTNHAHFLTHLHCSHFFQHQINEPTSKFSSFILSFPQHFHYKNSHFNFLDFHPSFTDLLKTPFHFSKWWLNLGV